MATRFWSRCIRFVYVELKTLDLDIYASGMRFKITCFLGPSRDETKPAI